MSSILTKEQLAAMIDHSEVSQDSSVEAVRLRCEEAKKYRFAALYVCPCYIKLAKKCLEGSGIPLGTAIAYPHGGTTTEVKVCEAKQAIELGADILDIVMNIGMFKSGDYDYVKNELDTVIKEARAQRRDIKIKIIIEAGLLTMDEVSKAARMVKEVGSDYVKTSTGFAPLATLEHVKVIRKAVGRTFGIKYSGTCKTPETAMRLVEAGADLIGESAGIGLVEGLDFVKSHVLL
jgi:deoxyribose-phosphate aldolase